MSGYYQGGPPQGGYPPQMPQQGYGYQQPPPQGQFPPQQGYGQPPFQQQQQQFQGGFNQYPPQGYPPQGHPPQGYPPQQHDQGFPPQQRQQQFPPQQQANYGPPAPPSPGYDPNMRAQGNATHDAEALRKAMKGFGTDEKVLITVLSKPDPLQMNLLRTTFNQQFRRDLESDLHSETSGYFREGLINLARGPLMSDVHNVHNAIKGLGTKESTLNDVLLNRSNADMRAIKHAYHQTFKVTMESDVNGDLSLKTEQLFKMVMAANRAEESAPINPQAIDHDASELHRAMQGAGTDQITVCSILAHRSDGQIRAISHAFHQKYQASLDKKIASDFSGHMKDALLLMTQRACDRAGTDATQLYETMKGFGTKDNLLVNRVVRIHWNRPHMDQVKRAYQAKHKEDLIHRVRGETSGDYEKLLVAMLT